MPFYEYECNNCGHILEVKRSINDDLSTLEAVCPKCEFANDFSKLVSNSSFQFKGSGWFKTDGKY